MKKAMLLTLAGMLISIAAMAQNTVRSRDRVRDEKRISATTQSVIQKQDRLRKRDKSCLQSQARPADSRVQGRMMRPGNLRGIRNGGFCRR